MRALIMAAGLGTRLRPLTDHAPKPLVPVLGRPMVEYVLDLLAQHGYQEAIMNVHYLPDQMRAFAAAWNKRGGVPRLEIQDESQKILGTGGAIALAGDWLFAKDSVALVCNADVISRPDLSALLAEHNRKGNECTLAVAANPEAGRKYNGVRVVNGLITSFEKPGVPDPTLKMFIGHYLVNCDCVRRLPPAGQVGDVMKQVWQPLLQGKKLGAWEYKDYYLDLGTPTDLAAAEKFLKNQNR